MDNHIYPFILDPISEKIFLHPVITDCGHSFEKESLIKHVKKDKRCPLCEKKININYIRDNILIKNMISEMLEQQPELISRQYFPIKDLTYALHHDFPEAIKILKSRPCLINNIVEDGKAPLHIAVETGQIDLITKIIEIEGINLDILTESPHPHPKSTAVNIAANYAHHKALSLLIENGASYNLHSTNLTPLQVAQSAATNNDNYLLLKIIKNMVEVFLYHKKLLQNKKRSSSAPKTTKALLEKLSQAINTQNNVELNNLLKIKNNNSRNSGSNSGSNPKKKNIKKELLNELHPHIEENDIASVAKVLSNNYFSNGNSKNFINTLETVQDTFSDQYEQICESLLLEILPSAKQEDTELLLKLFGPNIMNTSNFFDVLDRTSSLN